MKLSDSAVHMQGTRNFQQLDYAADCSRKVSQTKAISCTKTGS